MSMTPLQAKQLGRLIANARIRKGLSIRDVATNLRAPKSWVGHIEGGRFLSPAPDRLARLVEMLDLDHKQMNWLTKGAIVNGMPEPRVYFRSKLDLSAEDAERVLRYIERLRRAA